MPAPTRPSLIIRLTHSGQYADGRTNTSPVQIPDLDVGYERQDRKVPVYVPVAGSIDINASSRSMLSYEQGGIQKFTNAGLIQSRMFYVPESYTTGTLPLASEYPAGVFVWNTTAQTAYWSDGTNWTVGKAVSTGPASGDLSGTYPAPTVAKIQGIPFEAGTPSNGDAALYNSATNRWEHSPITFSGGPPSGPASNDLGGLYPGPVVVGLQGRPVATTAPTTGQALTWDGAAWSPQAGGTPPGAYPVVTVTANHTASPWQVVLANTSAGNLTVTLPLAATCTGKPINAKKISSDGYKMTVTGQSGQTIDGQTTQVVTGQHNCMTVISDGSNWWII